MDDLPSASDKAAALEAVLTAELAEDDPGFTYRLLGERLQRIKDRKDATDEATAKRLLELEEIAAELAKTKHEPVRLNLTRPGEHGLFTVLREYAKTEDEAYLADCARRMLDHLTSKKIIASGWSTSRGGRNRVEESLLTESWNQFYAGLGFDADSEDPPFLRPAVNELAKSDS
jgi:type I restriction enzyme R subunit